jgi:hypothetical protein
VRRRHRKDRNHPEIREAVEALGYLWIELSQTNTGLDAIVVKHGRMVPVEVKDGARPPSARKLTPHEEQVHQQLKERGITVEILTGVDQSLDVLRARDRNYYGTEERR